MSLFIHRWCCSHGTVHPATVLFIRAGSLPRAVTMPDDTKAAALRARLEAIIKEAADAEA
jgi:hypothetical protein